MFSFGIQVILVLILISGVIAYAGSRVGRFIGRRRLTAFNLRPRYTATAITVISGVLIALFTFVSLMIISQDARTAMFGMEQLKLEQKKAQKDLDEVKKGLEEKRQEIARARAELEKKNHELSLLQKNLEATQKAGQELQAEVEHARTSSLVYKKGEIVVVTLVESAARPAVETSLNQIISSLENYLRKYAAEKDQEMLQISDLDYALAYITSHPGQIVLKVVVDKNVVKGEMVPVHFEVLANELLYSKGEVVSSAVISEKKRELAEDRLKELLVAAQQAAKEKGIVPGVSGTVGSVPYSKIFEASKTMAGRRKGVKVEVRAQKDIYTIGPLEVEFKLL